MPGQSEKYGTRWLFGLGAHVRTTLSQFIYDETVRCPVFLYPYAVVYFIFSHKKLPSIVVRCILREYNIDNVWNDCKNVFFSVCWYWHDIIFVTVKETVN